MSRAAAVRFYIDADLLGLAKVLAKLRPDVTFPGDPGALIHKRARPACFVTSADTKDEVWIPPVSKRGWLIITRDAKIQTHRAQIAAVIDNGGRMVSLSAPAAKTTWLQLETVMRQWRAIEELQTLPGPFIYTVTRSGLRSLDLRTLDVRRPSPHRRPKARPDGDPQLFE